MHLICGGVHLYYEAMMRVYWWIFPKSKIRNSRHTNTHRLGITSYPMKWKYPYLQTIVLSRKNPRDEQRQNVLKLNR